MKLSREQLTIAVVLALLLAPAGVGFAQDLTHSASEGVVYQTNSGFEVEIGDARGDIDAQPFADNETWSSGNVTVSSAGSSRVRLPNQAFDGDAMQVTQIDTSGGAITIERDDLNSPIVVENGTRAVNLYDVELDDGETDLDVVATSQTTITVKNVPDVDGIQAVDANGDVVAGETDTSDNEVELQLDSGDYELRLQDGPSQLFIRDLVTKDLIKNESDPISVEVQFFGDDGEVEQRETTDGTIDMTGLPADERFSVSIDTANYTQRQIIIDSLLDQQTAYLLPVDADITTVEPRFVLEDPSGQFDVERSEIVLKRPLEIDGSTKYVAVAGDRVGINGYDVILERDQRYRVVVTDPDSGSQRTVGEFTPTQSEEVTLTVEDVEFDSVSDVEGLDWTARYVDNENSADEIEFIFRDDFVTQNLNYKIYERGNESNVLTSGSAIGNVTVTEPLTEAQEDKVWVVEWDTTRENGDQLNATRPVSTDQLPIGPANLPDRWQTIISMVGLFAVAGLFGAANPGIGGIAVASTGGLFFMLGWLPDGTGGLMVVLALFIAALSYTARRARGATA